MKITAPLAILLSSLMVGMAYSHSGAMGVVKERMAAMENMDKKSKVAADMFKGKLEFNKDAIADAADSFTEHSKQMIALFPDTKESRNGTEALPEVWERWDDFSSRVAEFIELSDALKHTVATTDDQGQLKKAFLSTLNSCSGCHKRFRKPKR